MDTDNSVSPQVTNSPTSAPQTTDPEKDSKASNIVHATESDFDEIIKEGNVVVDFWAEWCGPCHRLAPIIEDLSKKYAGKVKFVKVDTDKNPNLAMKYQIYSIPNVFLFQNGVVKFSQPGAYPAPVMDKLIKMTFNLSDDAATPAAA